MANETTPLMKSCGFMKAGSLNRENRRPMHIGVGTASTANMAYGSIPSLIVDRVPKSLLAAHNIAPSSEH